MHVGVLALQGAVREHLAAVSKLGHSAVEVRSVRELKQVDALIFPGGESTAMCKLLANSALVPALRSFCKLKPVLGTCAGAILLSGTLGVLNVGMKRNAFGSQLDSFTCRGQVESIPDFPMVFIRAPIFTEITPGVRVISEHQGQVVGVRQKNIWALSFHPELTTDLRVHELFLRQE